jgi:hypothetical protein
MSGITLGVICGVGAAGIAGGAFAVTKLRRRSCPLPQPQVAQTGAKT